MSTGAVQDLVDTLAAGLRRSVVVDDPQVRLLYASRHFGDEDDVRRRAVLQRDAGPEIIGYVLAQGVASWSRPGTIPADEGLGLRARWCVPVRWRGTLLGLLMVVDADGTLTPDEVARIAAGADELAALLAEDRRPELDPGAQEDAEALEDLVAAQPSVRRSALRHLGARLGGRAEQPVRAVVLSCRDDATDPGGFSPGHRAAALRYALSGEAVAPTAWGLLTSVTDDRVTVLVTARTDPGEDAVAAVAERFVARVNAVGAGRLRCVAGVGGAGRGLEQARAVIGQARTAVSAAGRVRPGPVVRWSELGEYAVLLRLPLDELGGPDGPGADALPDEVRRLLEHDRDGTGVRTVTAFLDHAGSAPAAADALHVHRTTLYYRLERIREATGLDLDDGRTRLALHAGLRLRELLDPGAG